MSSALNVHDGSCARCGLPGSRRGVSFGDDQICSVCRHHEAKDSTIDWSARRRALVELAESVRGSGPYDAVVPFGGGKDGAYVLYYLVRELGLRCLAVTVDNHFIRERAWENCRAVTDVLGVDQIVFRPQKQLVNKLMRTGFALAGDVCWHCNAAITAFPVHVAVTSGIPLVVHAHSFGEYYSYPGRTYADPLGSDLVDEQFHELASGVSFDRMAKALPDVDARELAPFKFPDADTLRQAGTHAVFLSNYVRWDERSQAEIIARELGWGGGDQEGVPDGFSYEKFDCFLVGTRDYLRFIQQGYGRAARLGAIEVRLGRMDRDGAQRLARTHDGKRPASLDQVLGLLGLDEEEFMDVAIAHGSPDLDFDLEGTQRGRPLHDATRMMG